MTTEILKKAQRRDRWVSWFVVGVFVLALIFGWIIKSAAEGRSEFYEGDGFQVEYPDGWLRADVAEPVLLEARDTHAAPFRTTLMLQRRPLPQGVANPIHTVHQNLTLTRGREWTAYRVLETEENVTLEGRSGMRVTFAYVETNPNPFLETVPVVMQGQDFLFAAGDGNNVYVATLTAAEANYERAQKDFRDFVRSLQE